VTTRAAVRDVSVRAVIEWSYAARSATDQKIALRRVRSPVGGLGVRHAAPMAARADRAAPQVTCRSVCNQNCRVVEREGMCVEAVLLKPSLRFGSGVIEVVTHVATQGLRGPRGARLGAADSGHMASSALGALRRIALVALDRGSTHRRAEPLLQQERRCHRVTTRTAIVYDEARVCG